MPKAKFDEIYRDVKERIEAEEYPYGELLPSEHEMTHTYACSRNTVRRAVAQLVADGYVQPMRGKGVRVIYTPVEQTTFIVGGIESFRESAARNRVRVTTEVLRFEDVICDDRLARRSGFAPGMLLVAIVRLRRFEGEPLILDHNWFRRDLLPGLTRQVAEGSIYDYIEGELGMTIATSKRTITVERADRLDEAYLDLKGYNCMAVVTSQTFNSDGVQFEYTRSRHRPDHFQFQDVATRRRVEG